MRATYQRFLFGHPHEFIRTIKEDKRFMARAAAGGQASL